MDVSDVQERAALPPHQQQQHPLNGRLGVPHGRSRNGTEEKTLLAQSGESNDSRSVNTISEETVLELNGDSGLWDAIPSRANLFGQGGDQQTVVRGRSSGPT
jgi:hypothetical protein